MALNPFYSIMFYPAKLLWPTHLTPVYGPPGLSLMIVAALAFVVVTGIAIAFLRKGNPWFLLAWLCYTVAILPTIGGLSAGIQPWADRYSYLPAVSLFLLLGAGIRRLWEGYQRRSVFARISVAVLCALPLFICGCLSMRQVSVWQNGESLWTHAIAEAPGLPMPYANLGVAREDKGDHDGALHMYAKAVGLEPHYADALYNMGIAYESKGLPDSAGAFYTRAIAADTAHDDAYVNLGNLSVRAGRLDEGIRMYEQAIAIDGTKPDPYYNMGIAVYAKGDREKALACFQSAIKRSAGYADAYHNMGVVYLDLGEGAAAMECFTRAARLGLPEAQTLLKSKGYSW
jgi:Tfp pilus assembly protein PilF